MIIKNAGWCNGNTGDFGSLDPGSSPGPAAIYNKLIFRDCDVGVGFSLKVRVRGILGNEERVK